MSNIVYFEVSNIILSHRLYIYIGTDLTTRAAVLVSGMYDSPVPGLKLIRKIMRVLHITPFFVPVHIQRVCVVHIKPFFLLVDTQHTQCQCNAI